MVIHLMGAQSRFEIRDCRRHELAELPIVETAADAVFPAGRLPSKESTPLEELERALDSGYLIVSHRYRKVVGFAVGLRDSTEPDLHLRSLAVHPKHARQGIGSALLRALLQRAEERGCRDVTLTTFADLPFNAPFYERLGFVRLRRDELDSRLRSILTAEEASGMSNRVAMRRTCSRGNGPIATVTSPIKLG